jgi:hypothetical protein
VIYIVKSWRTNTPSAEPTKQGGSFLKVNVDHYFWVRPISDPCGECFDTLEEAVAEAEKEMELERVHALNGPFEVVEVRGSTERVVWRPTADAEPLQSKRSRYRPSGRRSDRA